MVPLVIPSFVDLARNRARLRLQTCRAQRVATPLKRSHNALSDVFHLRKTGTRQRWSQLHVRAEAYAVLWQATGSCELGLKSKK